jgi:ribonuclease E
VDPYEARAALLDGDRLINVEIESAASNKRKGNFYRARVTAVEPSLDAAFVDYGSSKDGFLPFDEVCSKSLQNLSGQNRANTRSGIRVGDWILVQVTKEEVGKKGATLTMHVSLPGRFVVLMPFSDRTGVSRKLGNDERARLKSIAHQLTLPEGMGCIVRTVGETEQIAEIQSDLDHLVQTWNLILERFKARTGAGEVHAESGLALRFVRDYMTSDVTEILAEDEVSHRELVRFIESHMPHRQGILKRYSGDLPLFLRYGVERQIEALLSHRVTLPSGGSIVVNQTEALVAIDVNSGRMKQRDIEDTAFRCNLEAAREVARQIVLRDLGGIIVVDFIDMESEAHRRAVEEELKAALAMDKARLTFTRIQDFGLLIFSRQRLRQAVDSGVTLPCPTCQGAGRVRSPALTAMSVLRKIRERLATQSQRAAYVEITVPVEVANFLNNRKRDALLALESRHEVLVDILGSSDALPDEVRMTVLGEVPGDRSILKVQPDVLPLAESTASAIPAATSASAARSGRTPAAARSDASRPHDRHGAPQVQAQQYPDRSGETTGRERSFLRGLISRFLGIEALEEMPQSAPSLPPPPPPARSFTPPVAPQPGGRRAQPLAEQRDPSSRQGAPASKVPAVEPAATRAAPQPGPKTVPQHVPRGPASPAPKTPAPSTAAPASEVDRPAGTDSDAPETPARKRRRRRSRSTPKDPTGAVTATGTAVSKSTGEPDAGTSPEKPPEKRPRSSPVADTKTPDRPDAPAVAGSGEAQGEAAPRKRSRRRRSRGPRSADPGATAPAAPEGTSGNQ